MKDILYLCQHDPWLLNGGALIRNYWLLRALSSRYRVHLVTAGNPHDRIPDDFAVLCASIERFPRDERGAKRRRVFQTLRPNSAYFLSGTVTRQMRRHVRARIDEGVYAFVMLDVQMLDAVRGTRLPIVYNAHNTEYRLLERRSALTKSPPVRAFVAIDAARLKPIERRITERALATLACSPDDAAELAELAPSASQKIFVVPNGVDLERYEQTYATPPTARVPTVLITGRFDWHPNVVGLEWFVAQVIPALRARLQPGTFEIRIAGRMSEDLAESLSALPDVVAVRNPNDMRDELALCRVVGAAILASSGTRLRILEAWAAGRPVVTTTAGAFGLPYTDGEELFAIDDADGFAAAIARLLHDDELFERMRRRARSTARAFDWKNIGATLLEQCGSLLP